MSNSTVTVHEAAKQLGVSKATVTRLVRHGQLEAYKLTLAINSPLRIYVTSLEDLIRRRGQTTAKNGPPVQTH